jgi:hypothetical protein
VPEEAGFASGEHATPRDDPVSGRIRRHFPRQTRASSIIAALYVPPDPAGDGSAAIFTIMAANSHRVR